MVTGGAGFLGSHLIDLLISRGTRVYCLDNLQTGARGNLACPDGGQLTFIRHDVTEAIPSELPAFDEIYNLACPASPPQYQVDPVKTAMTSALGAWNVLTRAAADGARVFHASTSEVYGDPAAHPQPETYHGNVNPIGPRACYDEGKRFAESLCMDFERTRNVEVRIARIFNTYGPRMQPDDGRVVSNMVVQALQNNPLTVYGDGSQTRSFCYVSDLIRGFDALMRHDAAIGPVNIGNATEVSVGDLATIVVEMVGSRSRIIRMPLPVDDPRQRKPDLGKARTLLGWQPEVPLRVGLSRTIDYFDQLLAAELPRRAS